MKQIVKGSLMFLYLSTVAFIICYLIFSFFNMSFNIWLWGDVSRLTFCIVEFMLELCVTGIACMFYVEFKTF